MEAMAMLLQEPVREPDTETALAATLPGKIVVAADVVDEALVVCQVCFDAVRSSESITQICQDSCHGVMCAECMSSYLRVCAESAPNAIVSRFLCPICVRPLNMQRLISTINTCVNESDIRAHEVAFRRRVEASCEMLCPSCHNTTNLLTNAPNVDAAIDNKMHRTEWPSDFHLTFPDVPDEVIATCVRYCNHDMTADALLAHLEQAVGRDTYIDFAQSLWWYMYDPERRASLFLAAAKHDPFEVTPCCDADVCFVCKRAGTHAGQPCSAYLPEIDDMAQCPGCDLMLVKGDGCNAITCFCGTCFEWDAQVIHYRLKARTVHVLASHRPAFEAVAAFLRRRVWQRKYSIFVVGQIPMFVLHQRITNLAPVLFYPPWSTSFRTHLEAFMARRRVIKETAARRRDIQLLVTTDLPQRVQELRLVRLRYAVTQPGSVWRTSFKACVVRKLFCLRFAKQMQSVPPMAVGRCAEQSSGLPSRASLLSSLRDPSALVRLKSRQTQDPTGRPRSLSVGCSGSNA
ncbi:hypothetical protein H310_06517 [Aphanomyces invadans]|uniref:RING-type domain-containing protein n=1 Tax=Aphanomyces invadans TaxID=157072 RepID=A0A024U6V6_9STRA|nr:hypothetical protein H310_06517 [Aphanomyces invadans]ETW01999.1 hypothetical protein H310_06517 [Aphanomyces invadans]|eukprot:XP_008869847.1 hypothetical protein H310_06517 [Aphanomyces invadans]